MTSMTGSDKTAELESVLAYCAAQLGFNLYTANFFQTDSYQEREKQRERTVWDIVITRGRIEVYEYSSDMREHLFRTSYGDVFAFLRGYLAPYIQQRVTHAGAFDPEAQAAARAAEAGGGWARWFDLTHAAFGKEQRIQDERLERVLQDPKVLEAQKRIFGQ
jgi:hypothetical protein